MSSYSHVQFVPSRIMNGGAGYPALCLAMINNALHDVISQDIELRCHAIEFFRSPLYSIALEILGLPEGSLPNALVDDAPLSDPAAPRIAYYCQVSDSYKIAKVDNR